ncbi:hypothetical protein [Methylibium sp.]|uniref:hypothetical protein n=1 Tax=Methylibium sp. TaxID=2067992 RepID=UPI003D125FA0
MHTELRRFLSKLLGAIAITLVPVVVTAFISMPLNLNRHPGEPVSPGLEAPRHMT